MIEHHQKWEEIQSSNKRRTTNKNIEIGQYFTTNTGWDGAVLFYENALDIKVLWQDGSISC